MNNDLLYLFAKWRPRAYVLLVVLGVILWLTGNPQRPDF